MSAPALRVLRGPHNALTALPGALLASPTLQVLDLSRNRLSGPLPRQLASAGAALESLRLARNAFTGRLPGEFPPAGGALEELDLLANRLDPGAGLPPWAELDRWGAGSLRGARCPGVPTSRCARARLGACPPAVGREAGSWVRRSQEARSHACPPKPTRPPAPNAQLRPAARHRTV